MKGLRPTETMEEVARRASLGRCLGERFEMEGLVGSGGMGVVFRCRDLLDGSPVALKVLQRREFIASERFAREAETLSSLVHPAIVRYVAHGVTPQGEPYLAMEWLDGETLADLIARGPIAPQAVASLGARMLQALAAAHQSGIVHRDIKPSNIFVPEGDLGHAKLIDFGIAQRTQDAWTLTRPGATVGTPLYMAPEQHQGDASVDGRADVFSLGCVLFECLTGQPPRFTFDHDRGSFAWDDGALLALHQKLPRPLRQVLGGMLTLVPDGRPSDAEKLAEELRQAALVLADSSSGTGQADRRRTLSGSEQRTAAVALVSGVPGDGPDAARFQALSAPLLSHGVALERTEDGLWGVAPPARGIPGDLVAQMARWALQAQAAFPDASLGISVDRTNLDSELPLTQVVHAAKSVLAAATTGTIALDQRAANLLEGRFVLAPLGPGLARLDGERDLREVPCTLMGKELPCFGREREISFLEDLWQDACDGSAARVLVLTAPAGGGKSRVRHELCQRIQGSRPFQLLLGRGDPMRDAAPFAMLGRAVLAAAGVTDDHPEPAKRERLIAHVARLLPDDSALRTAAFLGEIAGLPFPDHDLPGLRAARRDAHLMADQRLTAWLEWLEAECGRTPVLLVLEDLHWADGPSIAFVDAALRVLAQQPFMVLALARPEVDRRFPSLWAARNPQRIALGPLSARSSQRMVEHVAGAIPEASARWIVDRAQGSPFFLQELLRAVAEGRRPGDDGDLPDTVLGMVQARLDSFGPDAKLVLRAASVFGESFRAAGVKALLDDDRRKDVDRWLGILQEQEVVYAHRPSGHHEHSFRHALFRQAAYELLPPEEKRLGHLLAGHFLADTGERDGSVQADHFERAGDNAAAVTWLVLAAQQALDANDMGEAIARVERAVRLGAAGEELCHLRLTEARGRYWKGEYPAAELAARKALNTDDEQMKLLALAALFEALGPQAKYEEILARYNLLRRPVQIGLSSLWLDCVHTATAFLMGGSDLNMGEHGLAILEENISEAEPLLAARIEGQRSMVARKNGNISRHVLHQRKALESFERLGVRPEGYSALGNLGISLLEAGQLEEANACMQRVLAVARRMSLSHLLGGGLQALTNILAYQGHLGQARAAGHEALAVTSAQGDRRFQGFAEAYLSVTEFLAGDPSRAEAYARSAISTWAPTPAISPFAVALLARALVAQGRAAEALPHAREAFAQLEKMGGVEDGEAVIRLALAECLIATDDRQAAHDAVASAAGWLRARSEKIDEPAYRESFLARIPEHRRILELAREFGV